MRQEDMGIADSGFRKLQRRLEATEGLLDDHPLVKSPTLRSRLAALQQKQVLDSLGHSEVAAAYCALPHSHSGLPWCQHGHHAQL